MKVAQVAISVDPKWGGKERFIGDLIRELRKRNHEVTLITCDTNIPSDLDCEVRYIKSNFYLSIPTISLPVQLFAALNSDFDIVHLHYKALFGESVALAAKVYRHRLVTSIHSEMKRRSFKFLYDRATLCLISALSNRIICMTDGMKNTLVKRGLNPRKVKVVPNAMYVRRTQSLAKRLSDIDVSAPFDLLFVGRLEERKGLQYLLKALSLLHKQDLFPVLRVVGAGPFKRNLIDIVEQEHLSNQVSFMGYVTTEELLRSYLHAKCVIIPSLYEGTPNRVAIEALALGKPIIITAIPGMEPIIRRNLAILVPPKNATALAKSISQIYKPDSTKLRSTDLEAKEFSKNYDWSNVIELLLSVYQSVIC